MMAMIGRDIGAALVKALCLPASTTSFVLRVKADELITVECEYCPDDAPALVSALAEYTLTRKPVRAMVATEFNFDGWMRKRNDVAHDEMMARHKALGRIHCHD